MQTVALSVRELVEFVLRRGSLDSRFSGTDRALEGARIHRRLQKAAGDGYEAEVSMHAVRVVDGIEYVLDGRADGIFKQGDLTVIDEIKTTAARTELLTEDFNPLHWAQVKFYAAFYCADNALDEICVQVTYFQIDTQEIICHKKLFTAVQLEDFLLETLHLYTRWAKLSSSWRGVRNASLKSLTFPFENYRDGQYRLAGAVYKTIASKGRLFACAPTGTGKTISTVFPALKSLGEGAGEKIFYLTAKTITRTAAEDAINLMREKSGDGLKLKSITLTAKDKICFLEERSCTPEMCPYANGYYDRINDALYDFLATHSRFTRDDITQYAKEKQLCPFELSLDLTNFCDVIICDYNYLFDPVVSLKRFFTEGGDFIFLIDEAHNLVDRARSMYSALISKKAFYDVKKAIGKTSRKLTNALTKINNRFIELRGKCEDAEERQLIIPEGDEDMPKLLMKFTEQASDWLDEHRENEHQKDVLQLFFDARFFLMIWELYGEEYTSLVTLRSNEVTLELICLDAAPFLNDSMSLGCASVLFSATLSPSDYFIKTLGGGEEAKRTQLLSPFAQNNYCLLCADYVSTKYADRERTCDEICRLINAAVTAKNGNYLVFLPSYKYMEMVYERFCEMFDGVETVMQSAAMDEKAREEYLSQFDEIHEKPFAAFCVLGGIFAEGIDLAGEKLIGSIIVGVGLPQINPVQNALRDYYAKTSDAGFEYAYQYPGMNKVLQAAGRVIRTENDKGMTLLIDARFGTYGYKSLFPAHFSHLRYVKSTDAASEILKGFWKA